MRIAPTFAVCCLLAARASPRRPKMVHRPVEWTLDGTRFKSVLVYDDATTPSVPAW